MPDNIAKALLLESLSNGIPALTEKKSAFLQEACIWCFTKCEHPNGVEMACNVADYTNHHIIKWADELELDKLQGAYNADDATEFGAEALALLLIRENTDFTAIRRAAKGTGIDYWLGYKESLFSRNDARLEISGILVEKGSNTIKNRLKVKIKQTEASSHIFPVFVSIIEFGSPKSETVKIDAAN
ncbi:MAG: hypothetical protein K9K34_18950 [Desulfarculaceae bacterium]|nr:hypothetical protein [Desulfarculaceae bacterium]